MSSPKVYPVDTESIQCQKLDKATRILSAIETLHSGKCYLAGGSLLPHRTKDYDVLIIDHGWDLERIFIFWNRFSEMGFTSCQIIEKYEDENDEDQGTIAVVKLTHESGIEIDLLYADEDCVEQNLNDAGKVMSYMYRYFPLSCQCLAQDIATGQRIGEVNVSCIVYRHFGPHVSKYKRYYPDAIFIYGQGKLTPSLSARKWLGSN